MRFTKLLNFVFYQIVLSGFISLLATKRIDLFSAIIYLIAVGASYIYFGKITIDYSSHPLLKKWGVFALFIFFFLCDFLFFSRMIVLSVVHIAMAVSAFKLWFRSSTRDYFYVFMISFGFLLISTIFSFDFSFVFFASWFTVSGIIALILFEMRVSSMKYGKNEKLDIDINKRQVGEKRLTELMEPAIPGKINFSNKTLLKTGIFIYFGILVFTVPTFLVLPRLAFGMWHMRLMTGQALSGFSEETTLGDISSLKLNRTIVMHVKTNLPPASLPTNLKWTGIILDKYDGRGWKLSDNMKMRVNLKKNGKYYLSDIDDIKKPLVQEFYLEPMNSKVVFMAYKPFSISQNIGSIYCLRNGSYITLFEHYQGLKYMAVSDISKPTNIILKKAKENYPPWLKRFLRTALEVPRQSSKIKKLVENITKNLSSPYDKAIALRDYLRSKYKYSLNLMPCPKGEDPVEFFLFKMKRGHCEYFASALAIMLRYAGIPSMYVNGFQRGEINPFNDTFVVRQFHAHSWVMAYFYSVGWIELDATPSAINQQNSLFNWFNDFIDSVKFYWVSNIVNFDITDQVRMAFSARQQFMGFKNKVRRIFIGVKNKLSAMLISGEYHLRKTRVNFIVIFILFLILVFVLLTLKFFKVYFMHSSLGVGINRMGSPIVSLYLDFIEIMQKVGIQKKSMETHAEFSKRVEQNFKDLSLGNFTSMYYKLRFSGNKVDKSEVKILKNEIKSIEIKIKNNKLTNLKKSIYE